MREVLLQMAVPLAQALQRQDRLMLEQLPQLVVTAQLPLQQELLVQMQSLENLLLELLSPPPEQVTQELLALSRPQPSSPSSAG